MKPLQRILFVFFWIVLIADCFFVYYGTNDYRFYSKLLLVPLLFISVLYSTNKTRHPRSKLIILFVLLFYWVGDVVLLTGNTNIAFVEGLIAFLIAHILYSIFFLRLVSFEKEGLLVIIMSSILIIAYLYVFMFLLWERIMELQIPVTVYALAICFMLLTAINTYNSNRVRKLAVQNFIPGAILFVVSDTLLAGNKFAYEILNKKFDGINLYLDIAVMFTYGAAQFLLVFGAVRYLRNKARRHSSSNLAAKAI
jgi:uncharacterized membrane protein YhhN